TIGYALLDSPVALAAWLLDHDTDSYYKISRAFVDKQPTGGLTRDSIVDNITLYWLTGTAASAARSYWEDARALAAALASGQPPPAVKVPVGFTTFPGRDLGVAPELGRGGLPRPRLLQRGRSGRPLRRLGGAAAVLRRGPSRVPVPALRPPALGFEGDHLISPQPREREGARVWRRRGKEDVIPPSLVAPQAWPAPLRYGGCRPWPRSRG